MDVIDRIKAYQGRKQPPVGFSHLIAYQVSLCFETFIYLIKCVEQRPDCPFVGILSGCKTGLIYAVIYIQINKVIDLINLCTEWLRIKIKIAVGEGVELAV